MTRSSSGSSIASSSSNSNRSELISTRSNKAVKFDEEVEELQINNNKFRNSSNNIKKKLISNTSTVNSLNSGLGCNTCCSNGQDCNLITNSNGKLNSTQIKSTQSLFLTGQAVC